jgi:hypothetical protein
MNELANGFKVQTRPDGSLKYSPNEATQLAIKEYPTTETFQKNKNTQISTYAFMKEKFVGFNPDIMTPLGYANKAKLSDELKGKLQKQYDSYKKAKEVTGLGVGEL